MEERILRPSRWKTIALLVMSVGFIAGGLVGVSRGMPVAWMPTMFSALCAALCALRSLPSRCSRMRHT